MNDATYEKMLAVGQHMGELLRGDRLVVSTDTLVVDKWLGELIILAQSAREAIDDEWAAARAQPVIHRATALEDLA